MFEVCEPLAFMALCLHVTYPLCGITPFVASRLYGTLSSCHISPSWHHALRGITPSWYSRLQLAISPFVVSRTRGIWSSWQVISPSWQSSASKHHYSQAQHNFAFMAFALEALSPSWHLALRSITPFMAFALEAFLPSWLSPSRHSFCLHGIYPSWYTIALVAISLFVASRSS